MVGVRARAEVTSRSHAATSPPSRATRAAESGEVDGAAFWPLVGVGVPMRFAPDGMSISIEHDGTPPVSGRLDCRDIPDMIPILSTLASRARGRTVLSHVAHAQLKESDRVNAMLQLRRMGAKVEFDGNDMEFEGVSRLHGAELSSFNDHRILMALTVAGSTADGMTEISFPHAYRISYPEFIDHMNTLGIPAAVTPRVPDTAAAAV